MTTIEQDIIYAKTWCHNSNLRMLGERIERISESHTALESKLAELRAAAGEVENALFTLLGMVEPDNLTMQDIHKACDKKRLRLKQALTESEASE